MVDLLRRANPELQQKEGPTLLKVSYVRELYQLDRTRSNVISKQWLRAISNIIIRAIMVTAQVFLKRDARISCFNSLIWK